jgi:predicted DCC family thiol-disulfide oxidoreductase YuxK
MPQYPVTIFYDGACPICRAQMRYWSAKDKNQRLLWIDIRERDFAPARYGLDPRLVQEYMYAKEAAGATVRGVDAFIWIMRACGYRLLSFLMDLPILKSFARLGYRLFAKYRYAISNRKESLLCDEHCAKRM